MSDSSYTEASTTEQPDAGKLHVRDCEEGDITTLTLDQDIPEEHKSMFENATPKAFARIRALAEK